MNCLRALSVIILLVSFAAQARAVELHGALEQGGMIVGKTEPGSQVFIDDTQIKVSDDGYFVFGFGRDFDDQATLKIVHFPEQSVEKILNIAKQTYNIDRVDGLPEKTVTVPEEEKIRREKETGMVRDARAANTDMLDWLGGFIMPAEGRISGVYGSQRILNGQPRWPHYGLDIANDVGTPVMAPAGGIVRLAQPDFLLEGGIIIIDHGFGVTSTLMHLSRIDVAAGQMIEQGQIVGAIGMTGRANGPHVDWRVNWGDVRLDPSLVLKAVFPKGE